MSISNWCISKNLTTFPQENLLCQVLNHSLRQVPSNPHHQIPFQNNIMFLVRLDGQGMWSLN
jgi:hypothetical protein